MNQEYRKSGVGFLLLLIFTIVFALSEWMGVNPAEAISSGYFIWGYSVIVVSFALWHFHSFLHKIGESKAVLLEAGTAIQSIPKDESSFTVAFFDFDIWVREQDALAHCWQEFSETLIHPESDVDTEVVPSIKNTEDASYFFSMQGLFGSKINIALYRSVPNILTGLGILGTFAGLMAGIYLAKNGLQSDDPSQMKLALDNLLSGASLAFMTSIVGVWCSLSFSWGEKRLTHQLQELLASWNAELDARLERVTPEKLGEGQLDQLKTQTDFLEQFVTEVAFNIGESVGKSMDEKLLPTLDRLVETVDGMRREQAEANEKMLQDIVKKFSETMKDAAGREMKALSDTLDKLNQDLGPLIGEMVDAQNEMQGAASAIAQEVSKSYREGGELFTESVERGVSMLENSFVDAGEKFADHLTETFENSVTTLNETLGTFDEVAGKIRTTCEEGAESFKSGLEEAFRNLFNGINEAGESLKEQLEGAFEGALDKLGETVSAMETGVAKIAESSEATSEVIDEARQLIHEFNSSTDGLKTLHANALQVVETLQGTAETLEGGTSNVASLVHGTQVAVEQLASSAKALEETNARTTQHWEAYLKRFENVDKSLEEVFINITSQLEDYGKVMEEYVGGLDKHTSSIVGDLGAVVASLKDATEDISDEFSMFSTQLERLTSQGVDDPIELPASAVVTS